MKLLSMPCALIVFVVTALLDWYYAYAVIFQPDIVMTAWAVIFPFLSVFYLVFCAITASNIYQRKRWSLQLASFVIVFGCIFSTLSFGIAYKAYPLIEDIYTVLLILNFAVLVYLGALFITGDE